MAQYYFGIFFSSTYTYMYIYVYIYISLRVSVCPEF